MKKTDYMLCEGLVLFGFAAAADGYRNAAVLFGVSAVLLTFFRCAKKDLEGGMKDAAGMTVLLLGLLAFTDLYTYFAELPLLAAANAVVCACWIRRPLQPVEKPVLFLLGSMVIFYIAAMLLPVFPLGMGDLLIYISVIFLPAGLCYGIQKKIALQSVHDVVSDPAVH